MNEVQLINLFNKRLISLRDRCYNFIQLVCKYLYNGCSRCWLAAAAAAIMLAQLLYPSQPLTATAVKHRFAMF